MIRRSISTSLGLSLLTVVIALLSLQISAQPQYSTNFFTTVSPSIIPLASNTDNKVQWVYYNTDFGTAPSGNIVRVYFKVESSMLPVMSTFTNFTIRMGQTTMSALPPGPWITTGMNTVFLANSLSAFPIAGNWFEVTLQTPFYYDNTKNFIIEVSHSGFTIGFSVMQASLTGRSLYGNSMSLMANSQNVLCDFGFDISQGGTDASLEGFHNLPDSVCEGNYPVTVVMKNNGPTAMTSATITWQVNNNPPVVYPWTGSLAVNGTANVTVGQYNFPGGATYAIRAIVSNPNNLPDLNLSNDTIVKSGIYAQLAHPVSFNSSSWDVCAGDSISLQCLYSGPTPWTLHVSDSLNSFTYSGISQASFSFGLLPANPITYLQYSATGPNGCTYHSSIPLVITRRPNPVVSLGPDQSLLLSHQLVLNAGSGFQTYAWSTGDTTQMLNIPCSALGPGVHSISVQVTDAYNCRGSDTIIISIFDDTGMESFMAKKIQIYPNPASDIVYLEYGNENIQISVYSPFFSLTALSSTINAGKMEIDVRKLPTGAYILKVISGSEVFYSKLLIMR